MTSSQLRSIGILAGALSVCALVALWTFALGGEDQRYQFADLKEDPLYLRGPGPRIVGGVVLSALILAGAFVARAVARRMEPPPAWAGAPVDPRATTEGGGVRPRWWWSVVAFLVAAWGGYLAGSAATVATGGPVDHPGTMLLAFGDPIHSTVEVPATCRTPPGRPATVATVSSEAAGLRLDLLDPVTGATRRFPEPLGISIERAIDRGVGTGVDGPALVVPGLPDRPPMYSINWGTDAVYQAPSIDFIDAYLYVVSRATVTDRGGSVTATAARAHQGGFVVDDLIPDDAWPEAYELAIMWTCDLSTTAPGILPTATPGSLAPGPPSTPRPPPWSPPAPAAVPAGAVPIEVWIVTGSDEATVRIEGASVASVEPPVIQGRATATYAGDTLRVTQPAADAAAGDVVGALFPVALAGITAGTPIRLTVAGGPSGKVAVTVYNALGDEPVPVFVNMGTSADRPGWPIEVDPKWLVTPVRFENTQ